MALNHKRMKLTIKEALEQGYTKCGYDSTEWQSLMEIEEMNPVDFEQQKIVLADKQSNYSSVDQDDVRGSLADIISYRRSDETNDDTSNVYDTIMSLDFTSTVTQINEALKAHPYWFMTKIELIP
jgi:hypothetical protein